MNTQAASILPFIWDENHGILDNTPKHNTVLQQNIYMMRTRESLFCSLASPLLYGMRIVERTDNSTMRGRVFNDIMKRKPLVRYVYRFYQANRGNILATLMVLAYGIKNFLSLKPVNCASANIVSNPVYPSELDSIKMIEDWADNQSFGRIAARSMHLLSPANWWRLLRFSEQLAALFRIAGFLARRYDFMPACRINSMIWHYLYFRQFLTDYSHIQSVLACSNYSPEAQGLICAARQLKRKSIYTNHAFTPVSADLYLAPLDVNLAILTGPSMLDLYRSAKKLHVDDICFKGLPATACSMETTPLTQPGLCIGIFLTGLTQYSALESLLQTLHTVFTPSCILIRPHPNPFSDGAYILTQYAGFLPELVITSGTRLSEDLARCQLVICGNSGAALEVLAHGIPVVYYAKLDSIPYDYNGFAGHQLIPEIADPKSLNLEAIIRFYADNWPERMRYYDSHYLCLEETRKKEVSSAIAKLIDSECAT